LPEQAYNPFHHEQAFNQKRVAVISALVEGMSIRSIVE